MATKQHASVDIGAFAASLRFDAIGWLREVLADWFAGDRQLSEKQKVDLVYTLVDREEELELAIARALQKELGSEGVETWGLSGEFERLVGRAD